ncbi:MAG: hypothetical protein SGI74_03225 [Oligoflexia bacterium]|nr:hypothetical protein [Oligoflexia bacterium]
MKFIFSVLAALTFIFALAPVAKADNGGTCELRNTYYVGRCFVKVNSSEETSILQACEEAVSCLNTIMGCAHTTMCNNTNLRSGWQLVRVFEDQAL